MITNTFHSYLMREIISFFYKKKDFEHRYWKILSPFCLLCGSSYMRADGDMLAEQNSL